MADKGDQRNDAPKEGPKKHEWWIALLIGIGMFAGSVFIYFDLTKFEEEGGERRMHWLAVLLYEWLGKWGLVGFMLLIGVGMTVYGFVQLGKRLGGNGEDDDDEPRPRRRPIEEEDEEPRPRKRPPPVDQTDEDRPSRRRRRPPDDE